MEGTCLEQKNVLFYCYIKPCGKKADGSKQKSLSMKVHEKKMRKKLQELTLNGQ